MFILVAGGCTAKDDTRQPEISEELTDNENRASQIETDDEEMNSEEIEQVVDSHIVEETIDFEELKARVLLKNWKWLHLKYGAKTSKG